MNNNTYLVCCEQHVSWRLSRSVSVSVPDHESAQWCQYASICVHVLKYYHARHLIIS